MIELGLSLLCAGSPFEPFSLWCVLQWAVLTGQVGVVSAIVNTDVWLLSFRTDNDDTCLHLAVREGDAKVRLQLGLSHRRGAQNAMP